MDRHAQKVVTMRRAQFFMPRLDGIIQLNSTATFGHLPSLSKSFLTCKEHGSIKKGAAMKFASIKPNELAVVKDDTWIAVGETLAHQGVLPKNFSMLDLIQKYSSLKNALAEAVAKGNARRIDVKLLKPPVERPSKIWAAAGNYKRGTEGLGDARGRGTASRVSPEELLENIFLKPPSAIAGPEENILIPKNAASIFPELELCVVIGKQARHLSKEQAFNSIFGYTIMLDVTARGYGLSKNLSGTRNVRKGFETFAPIGPWITTKDEISDPH